MIQNAEQIVETVRALPVAERERFFELIESDRNTDIGTNGSRLEGFDEINAQIKASVQWIDVHKEEYDGQWVCLDGNQLISHGLDAKTVYEDARSKGVETPFIERIKAKVLPWGGW